MDRQYRGRQCTAQCSPLQFGRSLQYGTRIMSAKFVHIERYRLLSTQKLIKSTHWWNSLPPEAMCKRHFSYNLYSLVLSYLFLLYFFVVCILVVVCSSNNSTLLDFCGWNIVLFVMCFCPLAGKNSFS